MSKNIKVLHTEWSDGWGGQEIRILNEMLAVREKGVKVFLACRENAQLKEKAKQNHIKVFTLPFRGNSDIGTMLKLKKIIKTEEINIINTHSGKDTWVGGLAAKLGGAKFIRTRHLSNRINPSRLNFINELANFVITTGEKIRNDMIAINRIPPHKIVSIPTGVDETRFNPDKFDKDVQREKFGLTKNDIVIGMVAVLRGFKRHDLFLAMAKRLVEKYENLKFILVGDGPQKENILQTIKRFRLEPYILLTGYVNNVEEYLSLFDIFILSSDSNEGVPQSVMQALLMKLPVVATDVGSTKDLFYDDNFILIEAANIDLMVEKTTLLIENEPLRKQYAAKARNYIVANFSTRNMCDKVLEVYDRVLNYNYKDYI